MDWSQLGDAASRILTVVGAVAMAWLTAKQATKTRKIETEAQVTTATTEGRLSIEDKAYTRAESYWRNALADSRRENDETRQELNDERRERREEHDMLNGQLAALRDLHAREVSQLRREHEDAIRDLREQLHRAQEGRR